METIWTCIHCHQTSIGHLTMLDNFSIVGKQGQGLARTNLNKNICKYNFLIYGIEFQTTPQNCKLRTHENFNIKKHTELN